MKFSRNRVGGSQPAAYPKHKKNGIEASEHNLSSQKIILVGDRENDQQKFIDVLVQESNNPQVFETEKVLDDPNLTSPSTYLNDTHYRSTVRPEYMTG